MVSAGLPPRVIELTSGESLPISATEPASMDELRRRLRSLQRQEEISIRITDPDYPLRFLSDPITDEEEAEFNVSYLAEWVWTLFETLRFMAEGDPAYVQRLAEARERFFAEMAAERRGPVSNWNLVLLDELEEALP